MAGVDWTMKVVMDMIVSGLTFGSGWMLRFEDRVHRRLENRG